MTGNSKTFGTYLLLFPLFVEQKKKKGSKKCFGWKDFSVDCHVFLKGFQIKKIILNIVWYFWKKIVIYVCLTNIDKISAKHHSFTDKVPYLCHVLCPPYHGHSGNQRWNEWFLLQTANVSIKKEKSQCCMQPTWMYQWFALTLSANILSWLLGCVVNASVSKRLNSQLKVAKKKFEEENNTVHPHIAHCLLDKLSKAQKPMITLNPESSLLQSRNSLV